MISRPDSFSFVRYSVPILVEQLDTICGNISWPIGVRDYFSVCANKIRPQPQQSEG